jgi:protein-L-isoaspartate(D-aspartate) O-methyltransferase
MQYQLQRNKMIQHLQEHGITDTAILETMHRLPRHRFVAKGFEFQAYDEKALPIGFGQTISHPYTVARMTQLLEIKASEKVLEIGTGSGYQAAVLCDLGARVFTVEIKPELIKQAKRILSELKYSVAMVHKDGSTGWAAHAPYDAIIVTAGAPVTPEVLIGQLAQNGGSKKQQQLWLYRKQNENTEICKYDQMLFVPLVGKEGW